MSEQQHQAADGSAGHAVKVAIAVVVGAIGLVIGVYLLAQFAIGTRPLGSGNDKANSDAAINDRIGSVVTLHDTSFPGAGVQHVVEHLRARGDCEVLDFPESGVPVATFVRGPPGTWPIEFLGNSSLAIVGGQVWNLETGRPKPGAWRGL